MPIRWFSKAAALASVTALMMFAANPAAADMSVHLGIGTPPPPVPAEVTPPARAGYVWAPGYYAYRGGQHVWMPGEWKAMRAGYAWVPDRWDSNGDRWVYTRGHWQRQRDTQAH